MRENRLSQAILAILNNPVWHICSETTAEESYAVINPDFLELQSNPFAYDWQAEGPLRHLFQGHTPTTMPTVQTIDNFDVAENRFAKFFC